MAAIGGWSGLTIDPVLLQGTAYAVPVTYDSQAVLPRWLAYIVAMSFRSITGGVSVTSGTTQGSNVMPKEEMEYTVVSAGVAVTLPDTNFFSIGRTIVVHNAGANALTVFPASGDSINFTTSISVPSGVFAGTMRFTKMAATRWRSW